MKDPVPAWSTRPGPPRVASSRTGSEGSAFWIRPQPASPSPTSLQNGRLPAMQSSVRETSSASRPARTARMASAAISLARAFPTRLGLHPGPVWRAATAPPGSTRMHSVLVPPPSTPIFQDIGSPGGSGELAAEPALVTRRSRPPGLAGSRGVLAAEDGKRVPVLLEPFGDRQHEPVEDGAADEGRCGAGADSAADLDHRVPRHAAVVKDVVGNLEEPLAGWVPGGGRLRDRDAGQGRDREALRLGIERHVDRRGVPSGVRDDDDGLPRVELVLPVVARRQRLAVAGKVLDEAGRWVDDPRHADKAAGAADDLARDDFAVAAPEGVDDPAPGDRLADVRCERGDHRGVGFAGAGEEGARALVVGVGE